MLLVVVLQSVSVAAMLVLPNLNARIIDNGIAKGDLPYVWSLGLAMLIIAAVQVVAMVGAVYGAGRIAMGVARDLRRELFNHVSTFSQREVHEFGSGSLMTRCTNDTMQVQTASFMLLAMFLSAPLMAVGGVAMAFYEDPGLTWIMAVAVVLLVGFIVAVATRMVPRFRRIQEMLDGINQLLREQLTGIRVVRAFVQEDREIARFAEQNEALTRVSIGAGRLMATSFPMVMLILNASSVAVLWFGADRVANEAVEVGSLVAFLTYLVQVLFAVMMAAFMVMMISRALVSSERIAEVFEKSTTLREPVMGGAVPERQAALELDRVGFSYPQAAEPVLEEVSFVLEPGKVTAIVGGTGSGKTTLFNLITHLMDATEGEIRLGGIPIQEVDPEEFRKRLGVVPQRAYLFSGTVASNLRYGKADATDEELWTALERAQAADFVRAMPDQLESAVSQGGTSLSGGQRQRLAIARMLVHDADILLLDDAFSALDVATDARIRSALRPLLADRAMLIVAQRISTIRSADQILVLDNGRIVGRGTHEELYDHCTAYQEVVASQLKEDVA